MSRRIVDLSTPLFDGIRGLTTQRCTSIETDGYHTTTLHLYSHTGTHMDAPKHFVPGGGAIDGIALEACVGPARVVDVTAVAPHGLIEVEHLGEAAHDIGAGTRLLLRTDWCRHVDSPDFRHDMPRVSLDLARWLVERGVILLGVEQPSVASVREGFEEELRSVHRTLLEGGVVIVEGLCNLFELTRDVVHFTALPLRLRDIDGSPVRAIAIEERS
jgi:kynurenine formamidase